MSASKKIANTKVKKTPEDIVAPIMRAIINVRMYLGTGGGVTSKHLDTIERAVMNAMIEIDQYGDKHREAGENFAYMNTPLGAFWTTPSPIEDEDGSSK